MLRIHDLIILVLMLVIIYVMRKARKNNQLKESALGTKYIETFRMKIGLEECFQRIIDFAGSSAYTIKEKEEENYKTVLEDKSADGFIYIIFLTRINECMTMIDVGIKSKTFETGPMMEKRHTDFVNELKQEIWFR